MTEIANNSIDIQVVETGGENAQYFWHNTVDSGNGEGAGAHITEIPKADFISDPENGGGNTLINSGGLSVRNGIDTRANFSGSDITLYTADGVPAFVVKSGSGSGSQTVTKVISQQWEVSKNTNYAKTYSEIDSVGAGETFDVSIYWAWGEKANQHDTQTFTKGTSSVETYTICLDNYGYDFATITATYNGAKQITWRFTSSTDPAIAGFYMTVDTISYTAIVNDAATQVSGNMVWKNPDQVFVVESHSTSNFNVAATGYTDGTKDISKIGYYPVGIVGHSTHGSSSSFVTIVWEYIDNRANGSGTINFAVRGTRSSAITGMYIDFEVLWVKCE